MKTMSPQDPREGSRVNGMVLMVERLERMVKPFVHLWKFAAQMLALFFPWLVVRQKKKKLPAPWLVIQRRGKANGQTFDTEHAEEADVRRLLERMKYLNDTAQLATHAIGFAGRGADFFANAADVEEIVESLIRENPPFLHIARELPVGAEKNGDRQQIETEYLLRDAEIVVHEPCTLFIPQVGVHHLESRRPPGLPVLRPAKTLSDLRAAPMLYQTLPDDLIIARLLDGSIPIMAYREERRSLLFRTEERLVERRERRQSHVPIEIEQGGAGQGARLIYLLFDSSTSLVHNCAPRGVNAIMELAIAVAMIRADMGRPHARYYFRSFADHIEPLPRFKPIRAWTMHEKDALVERLYDINFCGEATHTVDALMTAVDDIEHILENGELGENVTPRIGLLTDGRSDIYGPIGARLKRLGIELDTILIGKEAAYNPDLVKISSTVSIVDPSLYRENGHPAHPIPSAV